MSGNELWMILGMLAVTFAIRYLLLGLADHFSLPPLMERALGYVPPAVLTAITVPAVLKPQGVLHLGLDNAALFGALAAVAAGCIFRKQTLLASIGGGLLFFYLWRYGISHF